MAEVVNLNRFRKAANKVKKRAQASTNASLFGLSKVDKVDASAQKSKADKKIDAHKLDGDFDDQ